MAVRKIGASWWVDFRVDHIRYRKRSPQNTRTGAITYEATLRHRFAKGEGHDTPLSTRPPPVTFKEFADRWFDEYVVPNNKYSEQRTKRYLLDSTLIPFFGRTELAQIGIHQIEQYKARSLAEGVSKKTVNNRLTVLGKCLVTAHEWSVLENPPPRIKKLKCRSERTDYLTGEECEQLLGLAEGTMYELILVALRTGMRQGELRGLQWSSIDWQTKTLAVQHSQCDYRKVLDTPKNNRVRYIPLDEVVIEILFRRKRPDGYVFTDASGRPFDGQRLKRRLAALCAQAHVRTVTWHVLRHTFATHLAMKGVPLNVVQALLGHSTITMTMRYAHVAPSTLRTAIELLRNDRLFHSDGQPVGNAWLELRQEHVARQELH